MSCIEVNNQPVLFEWSKVDGQLSSAAYVDRHFGLLDIASVTTNDTGRYRCHATNLAGSSDAFAEIIMAGTLPCHEDIFRYFSTSTVSQKVPAFKLLESVRHLLQNPYDIIYLSYFLQMLKKTQTNFIFNRL